MCIYFFIIVFYGVCIDIGKIVDFVDVMCFLRGIVDLLIYLVIVNYFLERMI